MILIVIALICTILLLSFLIISIIDIYSDISNGGGGPDRNFVTVYSFIFSFIIFILLLFQLDKPKAIDVYKGKTTLEITYKNRMPIDSTVVWKNR